MKYKIDTATRDDVETLVQFQISMAKESEGLALDYATVREGVKAAIEDEAKALYLLAKSADGQMLGAMMLTTEWSDWNNSRYYWIQSVYVRPEARRQGVFRELFDFARAVALSEDAAALRLYVDKANKTAQAVYRKLGMHDSHYALYEL